MTGHDLSYREKIRQIIEPVIEADKMELVDIECLKMKTRWLLRIFIDKAGGVTVDDCSYVSHQIGDLIDVYDVPPGPYTLEVSSPGLNRPLARHKDFIKYKGSMIHVKVGEKICGVKNFRGKLIDYVDENGKNIIVIDVEGKIYRVPKELVTKANLEYGL